MKVSFKQVVSLVVAIAMILSFGGLDVFAITEADNETVTLNASDVTVEKSDEVQTVNVSLYMDKDAEVSNIDAQISIDDPQNLGIAFAGGVDLAVSSMTNGQINLTEGSTTGGFSVGDSNAGHHVTKDDTIGGYVLFTVPFTVPAGVTGSATVNFSGLNIADFDNASGYTLSETTATAIITISEPKVDGYTARVTAPAEVTAGTDFVVNVGVGHNVDTTFHAAEIVLNYDPEVLTLKDILETENLKYTNANGVLTVENFDEEHNMGTGVYTFTFEANADKGNTETAVTLKSAKFLDKAAASSSDLIAAAKIDPETATVKINEVTYTVTTADGSVITGLTIPAEVTKGTDLVIEAANTNLWDYAITAKIGDTDVAVTGPVDGKFTIAANNITGNIVLTTSRSGHEFAVVWDGSGEEDVTKPEGKPTYNEDYIFTVPGRIDATAEEAGVTYSATVSIAGSTYSASVDAGQTFTIPGAEIIGDVTIYVDKIDLPANGKTVSITGEDVKFSDGTTSKVVSPGTQLTLNLTVEPGYSYSVKIGDQEIMNNTTTTYTLTVGDSGVTITVSKDLITDDLVMVYEYLTLNSEAGEKLWLVTFNPSLADGKIPTYESAAMFQSEKYDAYCYLVKEIALDAETAAKKLGTVEATAESVSYDGNVNKTTIIDAADAQFVANMYNATYAGIDSTVTMPMFLSADMNSDHLVDILDAEAIVKQILKIS